MKCRRCGRPILLIPSLVYTDTGEVKVLCPFCQTQHKLGEAAENSNAALRFWNEQSKERYEKLGEDEETQ